MFNGIAFNEIAPIKLLFEYKDKTLSEHYIFLNTNENR